MKLDLINSAEDREYVINQNDIDLINLLKQYGTVCDYMTEKMVTEFYKVGDTTIKLLATRREKELKKYGYKNYKKSEIEKLQDVTLEKIPNRGLRLYPIKAVIIIGMMLTESEIAEKLRNDIINKLFNPKSETNNELVDKLLLVIEKQNSIIENQISMIENLLSNTDVNNKLLLIEVTNKKTVINEDNLKSFRLFIYNNNDNYQLTKKEFINLFNEYNFYHKYIGIQLFNQFLLDNNLLFGNDRLTDYAKDNNLLIRNKIGNVNKVLLTKKGMLEILNLIVTNMNENYKNRR